MNSRSMLLAITLSSQLFAQMPKPADGGQSYGTVNVILANKNGLVAVTDSMLTFGAGHHDPTGVKLFKIDDKTVCTVAGFYSNPTMPETFSVRIPNVMSNYIRNITPGNKGEDPGFTFKFQRLAEIFVHELTGHLQEFYVSHPGFQVSTIQPIELTLAGYDTDGSLKIGEVTLSPEDTDHGISFVATGLPPSINVPFCEISASFDRKQHDRSAQISLPSIKVVNEALFCEVAGLPNVAEDRLTHPNSFRSLPALQVYSAARMEVVR